MNEDLKAELKDKMDKAVAVLDRELSGLRTGRASVNLLDPVVVEAYGSKMPLSQVSTISTPDATTLSVQVWDTEMVKTVEKAIADANLGVNPSVDGQIIRINIPPLSEERRKDLAKLACKYGESCKVALRNVRRDGMESLKKMEKDGEISKDEHHSHSEEVQKITDGFVSKVDSSIRNKESDILTI